MLNSIKDFFKGSAKTATTLPGGVAFGLLKGLSIPFEVASNILKGSVGNLIHKVSKTLVETFNTSKDTYKTITSKNRPSLLKYPTAIVSLFLSTALGGLAHGANNTLGFAADAVKSTIAIPQSAHRHSMDTFNAIHLALTMATDPNKQTITSYYSNMTEDIGKTLKKNYFSDLGMESVGIKRVDKFFGLDNQSTPSSDSDAPATDEPTTPSSDSDAPTKDNTFDKTIQDLKGEIGRLTKSLKNQQEEIKKVQETATNATNSTPTQSIKSKKAIQALQKQIETSTDNMIQIQKSLKDATEKADQTLQAIQSGTQTTDDLKTMTTTLEQTIKKLQEKLDIQKTDIESQITALNAKIPTSTTTT